MYTVTLKRGLGGGPDLPVNSYSGGLRRCAAAHSCSADLGCFGAGCWLSTRLAHAVRMKALAASMPASRYRAPISDSMTSPSTLSLSAAPSSSACLRSEEHTSELQSLMRNSYDVFCLKK